MHPPSALRLAGAGMLALAAAIGIGRFAFTPVLPMMQRDLGLSMQAAGWLASANYAGYFLGALSAVWLRLAPRTIVRCALVVTALLTLAMGLTDEVYAWLGLRLLAGIVSAWALVFSSAWVLSTLAAGGNSALGGVVFGGVGLGTALAGTLCLAFLALGWSSDQAWIALGVVALLVAAAIWPAYASAAAPTAPKAGTWHSSRAALLSTRNIRLIVCYGCFGFGYIIPATFIPAMARAAVPDPQLFGLAWPVFGTAALISTLVAGPLSVRVGYRSLWVGGQLAMAAGVALPAVWPGLTAIIACALLVGGTFVVVTMAGMQEARRIAPEHATSLMAAMTAAFAAGQIIGPVLVSLAAGYEHGMEICLLAAAVALAVSAAPLAREREAASPAIARQR